MAAGSQWEYIQELSAVDQEEPIDDGFGIVSLTPMNRQVWFSLNPDKLADPVELDRLFKILGYMKMYDEKAKENLADFLVSKGFPPKHAEVIVRAFALHQRQEMEDAAGEPNYYDKDKVFRIIEELKKEA